MHRDDVKRLRPAQPPGRPPGPVPAPAAPAAAPARPCSVFMLLRATPAWLALPSTRREALADDAQVLLCRQMPGVRLRCFDAAGFHGRCTDLLVWDAPDLPSCHAAIALLREQGWLDALHFEQLDLIPAVPDGWREFLWESGGTGVPAQAAA